MQGRITDWKDDRGFGFITPAAGGKPVFFHISATDSRAGRPQLGQAVSFEMGTTPEGKVRALNVRRSEFALSARWLGSRRVILSTLAIVSLVILRWAVWLGRLPPLVFWTIVGMSVLAFAMYGWDKAAARRAGQRTPENVLQCCALLGGWPGALLAQQLFRHKSSKRSFQLVFWTMVIVNGAALAWLASPAGMTFARQIFQPR